MSAQSAPSLEDGYQFIFFTATENILSFKKHHPAVEEKKLCYCIEVTNLSNYSNQLYSS